MNSGDGGDNVIAAWSAADARTRFFRAHLAHLVAQYDADKARRVAELSKQISEADAAVIAAQSEVRTAAIARDTEQSKLNIQRATLGGDRSEAPVAQARQRLNDTMAREAGLQNNARRW